MSGEAKEISDLNLTYLLLAQRMLRADRAAAMLQLGLSDELAKTLESMTLAQTLKLATSNYMLCAFRLSDLPLAGVVMRSDNVVTAAHKAVHLSLLLAGNMGQAHAAGA